MYTSCIDRTCTSNDNGLKCDPDICNDRQKLLEDGTCQDCEDYTRSDGELNKVCEPDLCDNR